VIWEAFQPQTEQQRSDHPTMGDPYNEQRQQQALIAAQQAIQQQQEEQQKQPAGTQAPASAAPPPQPGQPGAQPAAGLQTVNTF